MHHSQQTASEELKLKNNISAQAPHSTSHLCYREERSEQDKHLWWSYLKVRKKLLIGQLKTTVSFQSYADQYKIGYISPVGHTSRCAGFAHRWIDMRQLKQALVLPVCRPLHWAVQSGWCVHMSSSLFLGNNKNWSMTATEIKTKTLENFFSLHIQVILKPANTNTNCSEAQSPHKNNFYLIVK